MTATGPGAATEPAPLTARRRALFWGVLVLVVALPVALLVHQIARVRSGPLDLTALSAADRAAVYERLAAHVGGLYDTVPDADVARVLQRNVEKQEAGADVRTNNAGMRSRTPYGPKPADVYRIVCLGDSFTYGFGGRERDRYGDQLEAVLDQRGLRVEGRRVEVYSLGIGSWNAVNAASYLAARLSAYTPDLVLLFLVTNDLDDTQGVRGIGTIANGFTPQHRGRGSGVLNTAVPTLFGVQSINLLPYDLGPESRGRWEAAFRALGRLERLLHATGGKLLVGIFDENPYFSELARWYHAEHGLASPLAFLDYRDGPDAVLPHDPHPSRAGHRRIALQYLRVLADLGWLGLTAADLPDDAPPAVDTRREPDRDVIVGYRRQLSAQFLAPALDLSRLDAGHAPALLGGILPDLAAADPRRAPPLAAPYAVLLLKRDPAATAVEVAIEVPPRPELYPMRVDLFLHGAPAATLELPDASRSGRHTLRGSMPALAPDEHAIEVRLETTSHWSTIEDDRTVSYRLHAVAQVH